MAEAPKTITVESIAPHTYDGVDRPVGSTYETEEQYLDLLRLRGFALPVAEAQAQRDATAAAKAPEPPTAGRPRRPAAGG